MKPYRRPSLAPVVACLVGAAIGPVAASAQIAPNASATSNAPLNFLAPLGAQEQQEPVPANVAPHQKGWPSPVDDTQPYTYILADLLEYRPQGDASDFRWDVEGWHGGDYNRFWFKSEGQRNTALKADYDIDLQLLYGRFIKRYYDFQVGVRGETQTFRGSSVSRVHGVIGIEGLVPYNYEVEASLFISRSGDVSMRFSASKDVLLTQRLILQPRIESEAAIQKVERFTTGQGLNNIEVGFRLRYEIRRKFAPYMGISFERSFFDTANLVRQDGGDPSQIRFAAGVRIWH